MFPKIRLVKKGKSYKISFSFSLHALLVQSWTLMKRREACTHEPETKVVELTSLFDYNEVKYDRIFCSKSIQFLQPRCILADILLEKTLSHSGAVSGRVCLWTQCFQEQFWKEMIFQASTKWRNVLKYRNELPFPCFKCARTTIVRHVTTNIIHWCVCAALMPFLDLSSWPTVAQAHI